MLDFGELRKYNHAAMRLAVGATRMQLLRLKKRLAIARRGHKKLAEAERGDLTRLMRVKGIIRGEAR